MDITEAAFELNFLQWSRIVTDASASPVLIKWVDGNYEVVARQALENEHYQAHPPGWELCFDLSDLPGRLTLKEFSKAVGARLIERLEK